VRPVDYLISEADRHFAIAAMLYQYTVGVDAMQLGKLGDNAGGFDGGNFSESNHLSTLVILVVSRSETKALN
jgi:hypothetical protein